jgi:hypothetical protein
MSQELTNVCHAVQCPYSEKNGCNRYTLSTMCHLAYSAPGVVRQNKPYKVSENAKRARRRIDTGARL